MPVYVAVLLLPLFAAGAYLCLRCGAAQNKRLVRTLGALFLILALLVFFYLLLTALFVEAI